MTLTGGYWGGSKPIYEVETKKPTRYSTWAQWPDDVRPTLLKLNRSGIGKLMLSFYPAPMFKCPGCHEYCRRGGVVATIYHKSDRNDGFTICDDCLVDTVRSAWND